MTETTLAPKNKPRLRRRWKILLGLAALLVAVGTYGYFAFAWVFFVSPGVGGEQLGLPLTVLAGNGEEGFVDGPTATARLHKPIRLSAYSEDAVAFADINNHAIRIAHVDGRIETIAGGPDKQGHQDGPAEEARFDSPHGIAVRGDGVIAVCEASGCTVRLLMPEEGARRWIVSTLAGVPGESGMLDGPCATALFDAPHAVVWGREGELYVADIGNSRIRMIRDGEVSTVAGTGESGDADGGLEVGTLKWPMDIALDELGALWIADAGYARIRRWHPDEGLSTPFADQRLAMPHGIAVTPSGHLAIAEMYGHRILRLDRTSGELATYCGTTEAGLGTAQLNKPAAVLAHAGRLWIADLGNHRVVTIPIEADRK